MDKPQVWIKNMIPLHIGLLSGLLALLEIGTLIVWFNLSQIRCRKSKQKK